MTAWLVIAAVGAGTYVLRASMFVLLGARPLPTRVDRALGLVGPAAVAALVAAIVFTHQGVVDPAPTVELVAVAAGFAAVVRTGNVMHALAVGLPVFWLGSALL